MSTSRPIKIGFSMSLSGELGINGRSALLAQRLWEEDVNARGGLLGRRVELVYYDDQTDSSQVPEIYSRLLDVDQVDLVIGGYGTNSLLPAMPLIMRRKRYFVGLMGLGVNAGLDYPNYFVMIPTGPNPRTALTRGFFELAAAQSPKPSTFAIVAADAEFARNPVNGAKTNAEDFGFRLVHEHYYPLTTKDFTMIARAVESHDPDVLLLCSYPPETIGLVQAIHKLRIPPKMVGGAMIGPQNTAVKTALGPMLNGLVNYDYWLPVPNMMFGGVKELMTKYQERATGEKVDALGYYMAPQAYAQLQVVEQAVAGTKGLDDEKLSEYTRRTTFKTVVGEVKFGTGGEWAASRVVQVQFQNVTSHNVAEFKDARTQVVVAPENLSSGNFIYPYAEAMKN
jgi:branched-chain amino acid transport system substrate-binding protein